MGNLINFIIKYSFAIVFVLMQVVCFIFIFTSNNFHKTAYLTSSNAIAANISDSWSGVLEYINLATVNDELMLENQELKNKLDRYSRSNVPLLVDAKFEYIAAKVIGVTSNQSKNFITINKGRASGIKPEMGVVGTEGVVGVVYSVTEDYATILPIINSEVKISVKLNKNDYFGSLSWDASDKRIANLEGIPGYVNLQKGDLVVSSGFSSIFPEGINVGNVESYTQNASTNFYNIKVDLSTDYRNLTYVYVINNTDKNQIDSLMGEGEDDE